MNSGLFSRMMDMKPTHGTARNWRVLMAVPDDPREADERIANGLSLLDGTDRWSYALWRLPEDNPVRGLSHEGATEFLQSAGTAQRMTIEMMRHQSQPEDAYYLYAVGKPGGTTSLQDTTITWAGKTTPVAENEVYTAAEAAKVYAYYRKHDTVPPDSTLRLVDTFPVD